LDIARFGKKEKEGEKGSEVRSFTDTKEEDSVLRGKIRAGSKRSRTYGKEELIVMGGIISFLQPPDVGTLIRSQGRGIIQCLPLRRGRERKSISSASNRGT